MASAAGTLIAAIMLMVTLSAAKEVDDFDDGLFWLALCLGAIALCAAFLAGRWS